MKRITAVLLAASVLVTIIAVSLMSTHAKSYKSSDMAEVGAIAPDDAVGATAPDDAVGASIPPTYQYDPINSIYVCDDSSSRYDRLRF